MQEGIRRSSAKDEVQFKGKVLQVEKREEHSLKAVMLFSHQVVSDSLWPAAHQASLCFTISWSLFNLMSIESMMPSNHLILCYPLLFMSSVFPRIQASVLHIRWPKYCSFSFNISPSNEYSGLILGWTGWISLQSKGLSRVFSNTTVQKHQFFSPQHSL